MNLSARSTKDAIVAIQIDRPAGDSCELRTLATPGYTGTAGDGLLDLVGLTGIDNVETGRVELFLVNNRPSVDAVTGTYADQYIAGVNATIELFETGPDARELAHVHTFADEGIATPNNIALVSKDAFYVSNDHGQHKIGLVSSPPLDDRRC